MKEIGEFLKASRIQNGVSVEEASEDLHVASSEIENLEEGNIKAFKDIYYLRDLVKEYSKYLGQDPDHLIDEFNDFMFEHTSKISLEDIKEAKKNVIEEDKPKVVSPYTYVKKKKFSIKSVYIKRIITVLVAIFIIIFLLYIWNVVSNPNKNRNTELKGGNLYEYTY